jgi:hypothetical protein
MKPRLFAIIVYLIAVIALLFLLALMIDEHLSRRQTQWDDRLREFDQAISLRPSDRD